MPVATDIIKLYDVFSEAPSISKNAPSVNCLLESSFSPCWQEFLQSILIINLVDKHAARGLLVVRIKICVYNRILRKQDKNKLSIYFWWNLGYGYHLPPYIFLDGNISNGNEQHLGRISSWKMSFVFCRRRAHWIFFLQIFSLYNNMSGLSVCNWNWHFNWKVRKD